MYRSIPPIKRAGAGDKKESPGLSGMFPFCNAVPIWNVRCQFGIAALLSAFQIETSCPSVLRARKVPGPPRLYTAHSLQTLEKQGLERKIQDHLVLHCQEQS